MAVYLDVIADYVGHDPKWETPEERAALVISALERAGWCIVPMAPSEAMLSAGAGEFWIEYVPPLDGSDDAERVYRTMIDARPKE